MKSLSMVAAAMLAAALAFGQAAQVPDAAQFVGPPQGRPLAGEELKERTQYIGGLLRCPVCQGLSVSDSPAEMAVNMKKQVGELLARGYTEEQILQYFERSYGQFVLLKPKFQGVNALVWLLPVIVLVLGAAVVFMKMRKLAQPSVAAAPAPPAPAEDPYVARVREMVGGGK